MEAEKLYEDDVIDLRQLGFALWRRKWIIVAIFAVALVATYVFTSLMTPIYEASTSLLIKDPQSTGERMFLEGGDGVSGRNQVQNSVQLLRSREVAARAHAQLNFGPEDDDVDALRKRITVQPVSGTETIQVSVSHPDAALAANIANAVAESFIELSRDLNRGEVTAAREFIEEQLVQAEAQLDEAELALQRYRGSGGVVAPTEETRMILSRLSDLEMRYLEAEIAYEAAAGAGNAEQMRLHSSRMDALADQIANTETRLQALPEKEMTLAALTREQNVLEQVFLLLRNRLEDVRIAEAMQAPNVAVIDAAVPSTSPISPRKMLNMALGGFLGLFIGLGLALLLEFLDTTVRTPDEIESLLGLPVLGRIPVIRSGPSAR